MALYFCLVGLLGKNHINHNKNELYYGENHLNMVSQKGYNAI
jgi:hypothetical protein